MEPLYQSQPYLRSAEMVVAGLHDEGILVERTIFYPQGGGQPGDSGAIEVPDGTVIPVRVTRYGPDRQTALLVMADEGGALPAAAQTLKAGDIFTGHIDWRQRYSFMRVHTALHLLSVVIPYPVTGGQISDGEGRLDFDLPEAQLDKDALSATLQELVDADHAVTESWISDAELDAQPALVKTMSVKPPRGSGRVRLVRIGSDTTQIDLQPCGGTHAETTREIGRVAVTKVEKKGRQNRRVRIKLLDEPAV
ncbi:MAG: alanyl-tRNA editing protein [Devosiaceae bacterium]|nr:alanyl-tRNA editing protein [Devosiaceae bacterium MH13]